MQNPQEPCLALQEEDPTFYYNQGNAKFAKKDYLGAIADYTQALCIDPHDWEAWTNLGTAYKALHNYAKSLDLYDRARTQPRLCSTAL